MLSKIRSSIFYKIVLTLIALILILTILFGIVYASNFERLAFENYCNSSYSILGGINSRFLDYMRQMDIYSQLILYRSSGADTVEKDLEFLQEKMDLVYQDDPNIESIFYYTTENDILLVRSDGISSIQMQKPEVKNCLWYRSGRISDDYTFIQSEHKHIAMRSIAGLSGDTSVFSYVSNYRDEDGNDITLCINIYEEYMQEICANSLINPKENMLCLNKYGEVIYSTEKNFSLYDRRMIYEQIRGADTKEGYFTFVSPLNGQKKTVVYLKSADDSNTVIKCLENRVLNGDMRKGLNTTLIISLTVILVSFIAVPYAVRLMIRPIQELKRCMDQFSQGNMNVRIENVREDEFQSINDSFNRMVSTIDRLIQEKYKLQIYNRDAEYYALVAQINPHFINNTLQSIGGLVLERGMSDIYKAVVSLSKMLRYSMKEKNIVPLERELQNLNDYLYIQKFRFEDKIEVQMQIQEDLDQIEIPKLTLQPLVENAIVHGAEPKKERTHIQIQLRKANAHGIQITICDDGVGIREEELQEILAGFGKESFEIEKNHIGLHNIYRRLDYLYGDRFTMKIESERNQGTSITIGIEGVC